MSHTDKKLKHLVSKLISLLPLCGLLYLKMAHLFVLLLTDLSKPPPTQGDRDEEKEFLSRFYCYTPMSSRQRINERTRTGSISVKI